MFDYSKSKRAVDPVLISIARGYKNTVFIGERIFPVVLTDKESVCAPTFGKTALVEYDTERAAGMDSNILVRERTDTLDLVLGEHDLAVSVDYCKQTGPMLNKESKAIHRATNGVSLRREPTAARLAQDEEVYHAGYAKKLTANDHWVGDKGDPIGVIEAGMKAVRMAMGLRSNLMIMGIGVMALLRFHLAIQAVTGANEHKRIATEILQSLFQIEEIVIGVPISLPPMKATIDKNSAPADIWGDNSMLYYVGKPQSGADNVDENKLSLGYILRRKGMPVADKYDGVDGKVKYCRYTDAYKTIMVSGDVGYLITGISK